MPCSECKTWLTARVTDYENGERIFNYKHPDGKGLCEALKVETEADFHCSKFVEGHGHIEIMAKKSGSPWHHHQWGQCPDCKGAGWECRRCAGTGRVLHYDDGYVGEEQTRRHPNEVKQGPPPKPKCIACEREVEPAWLACPFCGARTNKPEEPTRVSEFTP